MASYASIKRHKHVRRHGKIEEVFSTLLQDSPSLNNEALFCKVITAWWFTPLAGLKILRWLPYPGRLTRPS